MTLDTWIFGLVETFLIGQAVYVSYFSSDLTQTLETVGNTESIFILMLCIFILWLFLKPMLENFFLWWWYGRALFANKLEDSLDYTENYTGQRWGSRHMQQSVPSYFQIINQLLLQIVLQMGATLIFSYWTLYQYGAFDKWMFVLIFFATFIAFLGIAAETEIR